MDSTDIKSFDFYQDCPREMQDSSLYYTAKGTPSWQQRTF